MFGAELKRSADIEFPTFVITIKACLTWYVNIQGDIVASYPKFGVAKKVKVGHEVFSIKSFSKELKASSGGPGGQTGWKQAQVKVQCVEENRPHLGKKVLRVKSWLTPKSEFQS